MTIAGVIATIVAGSASAAFTGVVIDEYMVGSALVADVYFAFNPVVGQPPVLLNVFGVTASLEGGFGQVLHSNSGMGPSWSPALALPGLEAIDSFVTIGGLPGAGNSTAPDPFWGPSGFNQIGLPPGAGWFNANPPNLQGMSMPIVAKNLAGETTYTGLATLTMRLVVDGSTVGGNGLAFSYFGNLTRNIGLSGGTVIQEAFSFEGRLWAIPAPGTLLCALLFGVAPARRRRSG